MSAADDSLTKDAAWVAAIAQRRGSLSVGLINTAAIPRVAPDLFSRFHTAHDSNGKRRAKRAQLEIVVHMLASDDLLFQLAQEVYLMACPVAVGTTLLQNHARVPHRPKNLVVQLGLQLAVLTQRAQCPTICSAPHLELFDDASSGLDVLTQKSPDDLDVLYETARMALLVACAVVDPASAALRVCMAPANGHTTVTMPPIAAEAMPFALRLEAFNIGLHVDAARTILVHHPYAGSLFVDHARVSLGKHTYRVACICRSDSVTVGLDRVIGTSTTTAAGTQVLLASTTYMQEKAPCSLLLVRE